MATRRAARKAIDRTRAAGLPGGSGPFPAGARAALEVPGSAVAGARSVAPRGAASRGTPEKRPARGEFREETCVDRTGRSSAEWYTVLDAFGARDEGHTASAKHLRDAHGVSAWWAQALTVGYERARGLRAVGERPDGFALSVQRALAADPAAVWAAWSEGKAMSRWYRPRHQQRFAEGGTYRNGGGDRGSFRRIVPGRLVRFSWDAKRHTRGGVVTVEFASRGEARCTVKLTHARIATAAEREDLRVHWARALDSMKSFVERGEPVSDAVWAGRSAKPGAAGGTRGGGARGRVAPLT